MLTRDQYDRIADALPVLQAADPQLQREFRRNATFARIPAGRDVFIAGDRVDGIALLVSGAVRVYQVGETGREITLYRFGLGESCVLTANAILSQESFPAIATVEQDAEAVTVPADAFRDWVRRFDGWRDFVFDLFAQRLASVMAIVSEVAFGRMDARLAAVLRDRSQSENPIHATHQEIAAELGSSREVITRLLGDLVSDGVVALGRGTIEVLDAQSLAERAVV